MTYIFILLWAWLIYSAFSLKQSGFSKILCWIVATLPLGMAIVLRGLVGTDTNVYIQLVQEVGSGNYEGEFIEPAFQLISQILSRLDDDPQFIVNAIGLINFVFISYAVMKIDRSGRCFFFLILPIFLIDFTFNALRVGMAVPFLALGHYYLNRGTAIKGICFLAASILCHVSALYIALIIIILAFKGSTKILLPIIASLVIVAIIIYPYASVLLGTKLTYYLLSAEDEAIFGLSPLIISSLISMLLLLIISKYKVANDMRLTAYLIISLSFILFLLVGYFPWFATRLMWLNALYISLVLGSVIGRYKIQLKRPEMLLTILIGAVGFSLNFRQYINTYGLGESPFLPYSFFWES